MSVVNRFFAATILSGVYWAAPAHAYITNPVTTLGLPWSASTYVTVIRVEKVSQEKGVIIYSRVRDLKGKYPKERIKHVFDLKGTPAHKGPGDVPVRPDEKDWRYALLWAKEGKTAVMFSRRYDPYGDFGHTYIEGCWYATMGPPRDWEFWYAIYADIQLLQRWHGGDAGRLISALEAMAAGKGAAVPVLAEGTRDDLRAGRAKLRELKVSASLLDYNPARDLLPYQPSVKDLPALILSLRDANKGARISAARQIGQLGPQAKTAVSALAAIVLDDPSGTARISAADALASIGPDAKAALPALAEALKDQRMAQRKDVLSRIAEVQDKLKSGR